MLQLAVLPIAFEVEDQYRLLLYDAPISLLLLCDSYFCSEAQSCIFPVVEARGDEGRLLILRQGQSVQNIHFSIISSMLYCFSFPVKPVRPELVIKPVGFKRAILSFWGRLQSMVDVACPTVQTPFQNLHCQAW